MQRIDRPITILALLVSVVSGASCGKKIGPSEIPIQTTDVFTGTLNPLGASHHGFTVNYAVSFTDATLVLTSLTTVSTGAASPITVGLAFGNLNGGVCTKAPSYNRVAVSVNQPLPTVDQPFGPGLFCVQIFDNPDRPTLTEPLNYSLSVTHY